MATFTVTVTADAVDAVDDAGDGRLSLREARAEADATVADPIATRGGLAY
jgi:hypothetical protein